MHTPVKVCLPNIRRKGKQHIRMILNETFLSDFLIIHRRWTVLWEFIGVPTHSGLARAVGQRAHWCSGRWGARHPDLLLLVLHTEFSPFVRKPRFRWALSRGSRSRSGNELWITCISWAIKIVEISGTITVFKTDTFFIYKDTSNTAENQPLKFYMWIKEFTSFWLDV